MPLHHSKNIIQQAKDIKSFLNNDAPRIVGVEAKRFVLNNFKQEAFIDVPVKKWRERKRREKNDRALLMKSGRLKRSFDYKTSRGRVTLYSADVPYAEIHNEGGKIQGTQRVRAHTRNLGGKRVRVRSFSREMNITIPQRQFIGKSRVLDFRINQQLKKRIFKIMNNL